MWILLALALLTLSFNKKIAVGLLLAATVWAGWLGVIELWAAGIIILLAAISMTGFTLPQRPAIQRTLECLLVVLAVALTLHLMPGFHNPKVLDLVKAGPQSAPFTLYFNVDKALTPFVLLICTRTLFVREIPTHRPLWQWLVLLLSVPALLLLAVLLGGLKIESHWPQWLLPFALANLFFVSLAEEALFRGYLQQRLAGLMHPVVALVIQALIFGSVHVAGGMLLVIFASLAGVIYGLAWMWSGRLWVAVLFHFALNICHLLLFTYPMYVRQ